MCGCCTHCSWPTLPVLCTNQYTLTTCVLLLLCMACCCAPAGSAQQQREHREAAALAATEPLRAAVQQFALGREALQLLQAQLGALRGQTRAARLLTKHGCCVSIQEVAAADSAAAQDWLSKLLGRAERYVDPL